MEWFKVRLIYPQFYQKTNTSKNAIYIFIHICHFYYSEAIDHVALFPSISHDKILFSQDYDFSGIWNQYIHKTGHELMDIIRDSTRHLRDRYFMGSNVVKIDFGNTLQMKYMHFIAAFYALYRDKLHQLHDEYKNFSFAIFTCKLFIYKFSFNFFFLAETKIFIR